MWLMGDTFYSIFRAYRFIWLKGRPGGGKTAMAFNLALKLLYDGEIDEIYSNIPSIARIPGLRDKPEKCCLIIDEGGLFLKKSADFEATCAMLRKLSNYVIVSSVIPPAREFAMLSIQRTFNLAKLYGINHWVYEWQLNYDYVREKGRLIWTNPIAVFGLYDTDAMPVDDAGIAEWIQGYIKDVKGTSYAKRQTSHSISDKSAGAVERAEKENATRPGMVSVGSTHESVGFENFAHSLSDSSARMEQASTGVDQALSRIEAVGAKLQARRGALIKR